MSDDEAVYQDEVNHIDWLKVTELASFMAVLDPETESDLELWDRNIGKHSVDESFVDTDGGVYSVDIRADEADISGHDWVGSVVREAEPSLQVTIASRSDCGKPLSECYDFACKHESWVEKSVYAPAWRYEFKQDWNSISDRPTELDNLGLPGLREANGNDKWLWYATNHVCKECHIMTPMQYDVCQNCDSVLV